MVEDDMQLINNVCKKNLNFKLEEKINDCKIVKQLMMHFNSDII